MMFSPFSRDMWLRVLIFLSLFWTGIDVQAQSCGLFGRKIEFAGGGEVCVRDVPLFARDGLIDNPQITNYRDRIAAAKSYAIATTSNPAACPLALFISWDWMGHEAADALPRCNARLAEAVLRHGASAGADCRCEVLVSSGKSELNRRTFLDRVAALESQVLADGKALNPGGNQLARAESGSTPAAVQSTTASASPSAAVTPPAPSVIAALPASPPVSAQTEARRQEDARKSLEAAAREDSERRAREQAARLEAERQERDRLARQELGRQAEQERQRLAESRRLEEARKAQELAAREEAERVARELLARQEADRVAREQLARQEADRQAREQLARQEVDRQAEQERQRQAEARRLEQERLAQAQAQSEVDRRIEEERRRIAADRARDQERVAQLERERSAEQLRLSRELAELRRMLEERTRADAAARASFSAPSQYTERVALVLGNRNYVVSPLVNPINDALAVKDRLLNAGFKVLYFEDLKVGQIGDVLEQLHATLKPGAAFVFFYAGHGTQIDGENFFPAVDAKMTSSFQMPTQSLELARVIKVAESRKTAMNLLILDACRDNPWQVASRTAARGLSKIEPASGTLVFYATRPGSVAADGSRGGHGLFTYHLLNHLNTPMTPVEQVFKRVAADVLKESAGKQVPWIEGQLVGDFTFFER